MKEQPILGTVSKDEIQKEEVKHKRLSEVRKKQYETNANDRSALFVCLSFSFQRTSLTKLGADIRSINGESFVSLGRNGGISTHYCH